MLIRWQDLVIFHTQTKKTNTKPHKTRKHIHYLILQVQNNKYLQLQKKLLENLKDSAMFWFYVCSYDGEKG